MQTTLVNIDDLRNSYLFRLSIHRWGNSAKATNGNAVREYIRLLNLPEGEDESTDPGQPVSSVRTAGAVDKCKHTVRLMDSQPIDYVNDFLNEIKDKLCGKYRGRMQPSFIQEGLFRCRKDIVTEVEELLKDALVQLETKYRPAIVADWQNAKRRAKDTPVKKGGLGPLYVESNYPGASEAASKFSLDWEYLAIGVPEDLPAELRAEKVAEFERKLVNAADQMREALRVSFAELVDHLVERLTVEAGAKPKIFKDTLVANVEDFIATFKDKNLGDAELAALVEKAQKIVKDTDPEKLRKNLNVRDQIANKFREVQTALDGMIVDRKSRKFDLSEDTEAAPAGEAVAA